MSKLPRVKRKQPCRICGRTDWCGFTPDGKFALCNRVSTGAVKVTATGSFVHVLRDEENFQKTKYVSKPARAVSNKHLSDVYEALLRNFELAEIHKSKLSARGLDDIALVLHGYKSVPTQKYADAVAQKLSNHYLLDGVPGFYYKNGWRFRTYGVTGFIVPIKNTQNGIVGLTIRTDDGQIWKMPDETIGVPKYLVVSSDGKPRGASPGTPHHFALLGRPFIRANIIRQRISEIIITEGALKANVAAEFADIPVVGLVSITTFDDSLPILLKENFPRLETVHIAFDREIFDPANPTGCAAAHVRRQRQRLEMTLKKINLKTSILSWNSGAKGIDDHLSGCEKGKIAA